MHSTISSTGNKLRFNSVERELPSLKLNGNFSDRKSYHDQFIREENKFRLTHAINA